MAESRIIKRNVRFWGKSGLQLTGMMLIFMVVYGFCLIWEAAGYLGISGKQLFLWRDHKRFICHDRTGFLCGILSSADIVFWLRKKGGSLWRTDFLCGLCSKRLYHSGICRDYEQWKVQWKAECFDRSSVYIHDSDRAACLGCTDAFRNERNDYRNRHGGIRYSHRYCGRNWIY